MLEYNIEKRNLTLPSIPDVLLSLSCSIKLVNNINQQKFTLTWLLNSEHIKNNTDEFYYLETRKNDSDFILILSTKIDRPKNLSKFQCILNNNIIIKEHSIQIKGIF